MKKLIKSIEWNFDYYVAWLFYNGNKKYKYIDYMQKKWGKSNIK
jgi:hypothetical protein